MTVEGAMCRAGIRTTVVAVLMLAAVGATAGAQQPQRPDSAQYPDICYRFRFGPWTPPLDWTAAGHRPRNLPAPAAQPGAVGDASHIGAPGDSVLMLYPDWWPVGVLVRFDPRAASGDTLRGEASALVADANARVPTSRVTVIRLPCHAPPSAERP